MGGIGRRYANICLKKADIPLNRRAGELSEEEVERLITIVQNPRQYKIPDWSSTGSATSRTARPPRSWPTSSTTSFVRILRDSRRSGPTVGSVTTGVSVCAVNTPRPPDTRERPWVCPRRSKMYTSALLMSNKLLEKHHQSFIL